MFIKYSHQAFPSHISFWFICVNFILPFYFYLAHLSTKLEPISTAIDRKLYVGRNQNFIFYGSSSKFLKIYFFFCLITIRQKWKQKLWSNWPNHQILIERQVFIWGKNLVSSRLIGSFHSPEIQILQSSPVQSSPVWSGNNHNKWVLLSVPNFS